MKVGFRTPSIKKSITARTIGTITRTVKRSVNPLYGKNGVGFVKSPSKSINNAVYHKTSLGVWDTVKKILK